MTNRLFAWCEIDNELQEREPEDLFRCNAEGGWIVEGWYGNTEYGQPVVEIRTNGRHVALETWCGSREEAHWLFMEQRPYKEMQE
jgi:hypothetical protein